MNQAAIDEIHSLATNGRLTPEQVLVAAQDVDSPLHSFFEWDDQRASHAYRLNQARALIRKVPLNITVNRVQICVPHYIRDPEKLANEAGYTDIKLIAQSDDDEKRIAIVSEFRAAAAHLRRARNIALALDMGAELDEILADITDLQTRARTEGLAA